MNPISALRAQFDAHGVDAFYIPKVDEFMGEYIRPCDERLTWLTKFTGSAGYAVVTRSRAALFVDSRYTIQAQKEAPEFEIVDIPANDLTDWLDGERLGFDPLLIGVKQAETWREKLGESFIETPNLVDQIWQDRPASGAYSLRELPVDVAGRTADQKISTICQALADAEVDGFLTNNPESIAWLLNFRGGEIAMLPAPMGYMILKSNGTIDLYGITSPDFECPANFHPLNTLDDAIENFEGCLGVNTNLLPYGRYQKIEQPKALTDPIIAAKAIKNPAEIKASQTAHDQDAVAMIKFLAWLDAQDPSTLDEIKCANRLLAFRAENPNFRVESFGTISAWGANAANPHYHATPASFAKFASNGLYLVDSGGHYLGATTDITRTIAIGQGISSAKEPFTRVLNGLANISSAKFPARSRGQDIDALARVSLWENQCDYGHGTGHGVGAELSVHEGPASISKRGNVPLERGMILSLEPGFYEAGAYGIRLENLALVSGNERFYNFETLSFVPFDTRAIDPRFLQPQARNWLNNYHQKTYEKHSLTLDESHLAWLKNAIKPI